ncbi:MAG TPA: Rv3654c family TadE-like protein [Candidatus Lumbricidophila sp.]|nr:Rv3654c family TadE-like protein [Candidatus Lumbricidophila sp.]
MAGADVRGTPAGTGVRSAVVARRLLRCDRGAGSVLLIGLAGALVALSSVVVVGGTGWAAAQRAAAAAEQGALAGADAASGRVSGSPCDVARRTAERNGASMRDCRVSGLIVRIEVASPALGIEIMRAARAGPPE